MKTQLYHYFIILITSLLLIAIVTSCNDSHIAAIDQGEMDAATIGSVSSLSNQEKGKLSPQEAYDAFFDMVEKVQSMQREEIKTLSDSEIIDLGQPILDATRNTILLDKNVLDTITSLVNERILYDRDLTKMEHLKLSKLIESKISSAGISRRELQVNDVKQILLDFQKKEGIESMSTCSSLFNVGGGNVILFPGDQLNLANMICPSDSYFYLTGGTYYNQSVFNSKNGNQWVGAGNFQAIIDGLNSSPSAFVGGMSNNSIRWMEIRNYQSHGIYSTSTSTMGLSINNMRFYNIVPDITGPNTGPNAVGQSNAAITLWNSENISIENSYFENVLSGIRLVNSKGPLQVLNNEALNPGRNFFQCNNCEGGGIRINGNSLEHTTGFGNSILEDWFNLWESEGTHNDYIQIKNNRARVILSNGQATKVSNSGCMVLLGDNGGKFQQAKNNIGVNPGNCGIGLASGKNMYISENKMYSAAVPGVSNVAFYSINFYSPKSCKYHHFVSQSNIADWICDNPERCDSPPEKNLADADGSCTGQNDNPITRTILEGLIKDQTLGAGIWNDW
ncbi:MAG: hypothetical protein JJU37_10395 [Balneolaceae bacterium]|nr:hypothetical protein [Balneolaceae bacterium]